MADLKLLERLCAARGVSGSEDSVCSLILDEIVPYAASVEVDALGNVIAFKKGIKTPPVRLMLSAHMDEVGLIVTHITEDGLLKFAEVGGIDRRVLCGTPVIVNDHLQGVIGAKPVHLLEKEEREKAVPLEDLYIDIGAAGREEAEQVTAPGDAVCFDSGFGASHGMIRSRALDDRAGCALLIGMLRRELPYDMTFAFVVQEEIGLRGSKTAAYAIAPQAAIVVETTTAADIADVEEDRQVCRLGRGPVISFMDKRTLYDREYFRLALQTAEENGIPCQVKEAVAGGNDAGSIHVSRGGVRTAAVSLACRYLHAPVGVISEADFHSTGELLFRLAEKIAGGSSAR